MRDSSKVRTEYKLQDGLQLSSSPPKTSRMEALVPEGVMAWDCRAGKAVLPLHTTRSHVYVSMSKEQTSFCNTSFCPNKPKPLLKHNPP